MKNEMTQYEELFKDSLFDEAFMLLEKNVSQIDDRIARNKYIRDFFGFIFDDNYFNQLFDNERLLPLSSSFVEHLMTRPFLQEMGSKLGNFVDEDMISVMYSLLLQNSEFDRAKFLIPFFQANLGSFPKTINEIVNNKNIPALRFVCENMKNIHFNEGSLLRICMAMPPMAIAMLVEEFHFDINEQSADTGMNLVHAVVSDKNLKNFRFLVENYGNTINWSLSANRKNKPPVSIFDMIEQSNMPIDFYEIILSDSTLKSAYVERIAQTLLSDHKTVAKAVQTDIFDKLFSHPNFDNQIINLGQGYFIYGILTRIGQTAKSEGDEVAKHYVKVLDSYLKNTEEDSVPESTNYHIVGAAVFIASVSESKLVSDAARLVMQRYPDYINIVNPDGKMPIEQVEKNSPLFKVLVSEGAVYSEPEKGWFSWGRSKKQTLQDMETRAKVAANRVERHAQQPTGSLTSLRVQMRSDFMAMRGLITNPLCDPTIKFKCENMFLKAEKLATMIEKHNVTNAYDELHFLSENFARYLPNTVKAYIDVCQAAWDLAADDKKKEKMEEAKTKCDVQIALLDEQVKLISNNIFSDVEHSAQASQRVQGRFLNSRFEDTARNYSANKEDVKVQTENGEASIVQINTDSVSPPAREADNSATGSAINIFESLQEGEQPANTPPSRNKLKL